MIFKLKYHHSNRTPAGNQLVNTYNGSFYRGNYRLLIQQIFFRDKKICVIIFNRTKMLGHKQ